MAATAGVLVQRIERQLSQCALWPERFPPEQWALYKRVMKDARARGLNFAIGGALASTTYSGQWRNTKDIDLYIKASDREKMLAILSDAGLADYYDEKPYDRNWIYRSWRDDLIVDVMWAMANQRAQVDDDWLRGPEVEVEGELFRLLPPEETLWSKLYVMQRDRCDWPDAFSLLSKIGPEIDWRHLLGQSGRRCSIAEAAFLQYSNGSIRKVPGNFQHGAGRIRPRPASPCRTFGSIAQPRQSARFPPVVPSGKWRLGTGS